MITSTQNTKVKTVRSLQAKAKYRRESGLVLCEGIRLTEEARRSNWKPLFVLYSGEGSERANILLDGFLEHGDAVEEVSPELMREMSDTETSQGILAVYEIHPQPISETADFFLIPAQIRDPGNLGTLLRTAAAAGVSAVLIPPETVDAFSPKVMRSGMGAHFHVPILVLPWSEISEKVRSVAGMRTFLAAAGSGSAYTQTDFVSPTTLMIGGEAAGASEEAKLLVDGYVQIPMPGIFESLNAAVAGAILIYEVIRQRSDQKA